jgi:hypothetical protein
MDSEIMILEKDATKSKAKVGYIASRKTLG